MGDGGVKWHNLLIEKKLLDWGKRNLQYFLKKTFSLSEDIEEIINERISVLLDIYDRELSLVRGLTELLDSVSKSSLKVALASSSPLKVIEFVLSKFDLNKYFDLVVSGDMVEHGKPSPDIYNYTAERLGLECDECVVIEDSINGVISAKSAGMYCIAIPDKRLNPDGFKKADIIISNLEYVDLQVLTKFGV